jgi:hypothetical protein
VPRCVLAATGTTVKNACPDFSDARKYSRKEALRCRSRQGDLSDRSGATGGRARANFADTLADRRLSASGARAVPPSLVEAFLSSSGLGARNGCVLASTAAVCKSDAHVYRPDRCCLSMPGRAEPSLEPSREGENSPTIKRKSVCDEPLRAVRNQLHG